MKRQNMIAGLALSILAAGCGGGPAPTTRVTGIEDEVARRVVAAAWIDIINARAPFDGVLTGGQPTADQLALARQHGYRTIVNLRGPGEPGELAGEAARVEELGMDYVVIPMASVDDLNAANASKLAAALGAEALPAMVHCASGNRVGALFGLSAHLGDGLPAEAALAIARHAGITRMEPVLRQRLGLPPDYLDFETPGTYQAGGVRMIQLEEGYRVWTKRVGNAPAKVLLLHGGPAATHEYMECFESFFPQAGIEFYHYDQLGSYRSDQPTDKSLWTVERFVEEVEQVRLALGLDRNNFFLLGNSWGGMLAMEYALKYQQNLKGLIVCNMTASFDKYEAYNASLRAQLSPDVLERLESYEQRGDYHDPDYEALVFSEYYTKHFLRMEEWPEPVARSFKHLNQEVYEYMQGPSEFVPGGILAGWSVWDRLGELTVPTLTVGARYDTMNPEEMEEMSRLVQNGRYLHCPNGSHLAMWDDQQVFMDGVIDFIHDVQNGED